MRLNNLYNSIKFAGLIVHQLVNILLNPFGVPLYRLGKSHYARARLGQIVGTVEIDVSPAKIGDQRRENRSIAFIVVGEFAALPDIEGHQ